MENANSTKSTSHCVLSTDCTDVLRSFENPVIHHHHIIKLIPISYNQHKCYFMRFTFLLRALVQGLGLELECGFSTVGRSLFCESTDSMYENLPFRFRMKVQRTSCLPVHIIQMSYIEIAFATWMCYLKPSYSNSSDYSPLYYP